MSALAGGLEVEPFTVPLKVPPVMKPVRSTATHDFYEVTMRKARTRIVPGTKTRIWGFDGRFPGPTIKATKGREIIIRRRNELDVPTSIHLHGGEVPWKSDGHPSRAIRPGEAYDYVYPNQQDAATLWYHDHLCKHTSRNNYMGLSGFYLIEDEEEEALGLPSGKYDIPLAIHDRSFRRDGSLRFRDKVDGLFGNVFLVNGRPMPYLEVDKRKYRFRILNGSHSRGYNLRLGGGMPMTQIGSDQGLLPAPYPATSIPLWPSERVEVVIDFSLYPTGTNVVLEDADQDNPTVARPVMEFRVGEAAADDSEVPAVLKPITPLTPGPDAVEREFTLSKNTTTNRWEINGKPFRADRIDIKPRLGNTEVWTFNNISSETHPMHVHVVRFQILERSNLALTPGEMGWKDTVRVDPSASVRIVMRFGGFGGRFMYHCHNLAHEDHSMMGQMRLRDPDGTAKKTASRFSGGYAGNSRAPALGYWCDLKR